MSCIGARTRRQTRGQSSGRCPRPRSRNYASAPMMVVGPSTRRPAKRHRGKRGIPIRHRIERRYSYHPDILGRRISIRKLRAVPGGYDAPQAVFAKEEGPCQFSLGTALGVGWVSIPCGSQARSRGHAPADKRSFPGKARYLPGLRRRLVSSLGPEVDCLRRLRARLAHATGSPPVRSMASARRRDNPQPAA